MANQAQELDPADERDAPVRHDAIDQGRGERDADRLAGEDEAADEAALDRSDPAGERDDAAGELRRAVHEEQPVPGHGLTEQHERDDKADHVGQPVARCVGKGERPRSSPGRSMATPSPKDRMRWPKRASRPVWPATSRSRAVSRCTPATKAAEPTTRTAPDSARTSGEPTPAMAAATRSNPKMVVVEKKPDASTT